MHRNDSNRRHATDSVEQCGGRPSAEHSFIEPVHIATLLDLGWLDADAIPPPAPD